MKNDIPAIRYFGSIEYRKTWEVQIPTPVGETCLLCGETIIDGDIGTINMANQITHYECDLRQVIGSLAHQQKRCSCYGGKDDHLPDGMTRRQDARAAATYWEARQLSSPFKRLLIGDE